MWHVYLYDAITAEVRRVSRTDFIPVVDVITMTVDDVYTYTMMRWLFIRHIALFWPYTCSVHCGCMCICYMALLAI